MNVRQYSRVGASAPALAREAPEIIARWDPPWVVALLADNDLATSALVGRSRFAIEPDGSFRLVTGPGPPPLRGLRGLWRRIYEGSSRHSILAYASFRRVGQVRGEPLRPDPPLRPDNPRYPILRHVSSVSVRALHAAYGDRLLIVYLPHVGATPDEDYHHHEAGLLEACRVEGVRCLSMRADFLRARERDHRLTRGFVNTPPAWGHLNEHGHRLVGEAIAREVGR